MQNRSERIENILKHSFAKQINYFSSSIECWENGIRRLEMKLKSVKNESDKYIIESCLLYYKDLLKKSKKNLEDWEEGFKEIKLKAQKMIERKL